MLSVDIKCPGCELRTTAWFRKKPSLLSPTVLVHRCENCQSLLAVHVEKPQRAKHPGTVEHNTINTRVRLVEESPTLKALKKELAEFATQPPELPEGELPT